MENMNVDYHPALERAERMMHEVRAKCGDAQYDDAYVMCAMTITELRALEAALTILNAEQRLRRLRGIT